VYLGPQIGQENVRSKLELNGAFISAQSRSGLLCQPSAAIFDLDGTITDSKPGIVGCLRKVLGARHMKTRGPLDRFVGPPETEWTAELLPKGSADDRATLAREYRSCYDREGWKNNSVFAGVSELLARLKRNDIALFVCTSKQQHFAVRVLDHFGLGELFDGIYGDNSEYHLHSKVELLATLLHKQAVDKESAIMIGDRIYDFEAARANGVRCIAAAWGYGSSSEHEIADAVALNPACLGDLMLPTEDAGTDPTRIAN